MLRQAPNFGEQMFFRNANRIYYRLLTLLGNQVFLFDIGLICNFSHLKKTGLGMNNIRYLYFRRNIVWVYAAMFSLKFHTISGMISGTCPDDFPFYHYFFP